MLWFIINFILSFIGAFITYNLALSFCGFFLKLRETLIPVSLFSVLIFMSKILLNSTATLHTILLVISCTLIIKVFNRIDFVLSMIGALLTFILIIVTNLIFIYPLSRETQIVFVCDMQNFKWVLFNLGELLAPLIALLVLRIKRRSIINYLSSV